MLSIVNTCPPLIRRKSFVNPDTLIIGSSRGRSAIGYSGSSSDRNSLIISDVFPISFTCPLYSSSRRSASASWISGWCDIFH